MDESEENMSTDDVKSTDSPLTVKTKPKKRSLVERELETSLTARVTSPVTNSEGTSTSRYGRARRLKTESENTDKKAVDIKSPLADKSPMKTQSPVYKMHASNSPLKAESPTQPPAETYLENQIENIYQENISLSRFAKEEVTNQSPTKKYPKVYIRKDLIQNRDPEETITLIKNMFSPVKSEKKKSSSHLNNILERSCERFNLSLGGKTQNGLIDNSSVVKTLDFDSKRKKKENRETKSLSKSELFDLEAKCAYQVGDLAWARMGTFPFWPCIVTREPTHGVFVKKKLFGRIERDVIHVTFFGDNGRRGWIADSMLRKYLGQLEFEATRENFTPEDKKKDPRLYAAFFVSEKKQALWNTSVEEAETLLREPKRLRIDIFNEMLEKSRSLTKHNKVGKISRTDSDVSLSESLYDTLFSEEDCKTDNAERARNRSRNKSLDVFDVVTACLDNMAAKTGITKIQKQSHMDRWLQKAKSKTPEKIQVPATKEVKTSSKKKKKTPSKEVRVRNPYSLRRSTYESQNLLPFQNEHDYSKAQNVTDDSEDTDGHNSVDIGSGAKCTVEESLSDKLQDMVNDESTTDSQDSKEVTDDTETSDSAEVIKDNCNKESVNVTGVECNDVHELFDKDIKQLDGPVQSQESVEVSNESPVIQPQSKQLEVNVELNEPIVTDSSAQINTSKSQQDDWWNKDSNEVISNDEELFDSVTKEEPFEKNLQKQPIDYNDDNCVKDNVIKNQVSEENLHALKTIQEKHKEDEEKLNEHDLETAKAKDETELNKEDDINENNTKTIEVEEKSDKLNSSLNDVETNMSVDYDSDSDYQLPYSPLSVDLNKDKPTLDDLQMDQDLDGFDEPNSATSIENGNCQLSKTCLNDNLGSLTECGNIISSCDRKERDLCDSNHKYSTKLVETDKNAAFNLDDKAKYVSDYIEENFTNKKAKPIDIPIEYGEDSKDNESDKVSRNKDSENQRVNSLNLYDNIDKIIANGYLSIESKTPEGVDKDVKAINIPKIIKENGFHDSDFDIDTASIHSEDSAASSRSGKRKLRSRDKKIENPLSNPEFVAYMELRQDALMDENPELSQKEIVAYLHKTWLYEESLKPENKKRNDDLRQSNLVKDLQKEPTKTARKKNLSLNRNNKLNFFQKKKGKVTPPKQYNGEISSKEVSVPEKKKYRRIISHEDYKYKTKEVTESTSGSDGNSSQLTMNEIIIEKSEEDNKSVAVKAKIDSPVEINPVEFTTQQASIEKTDAIKPKNEILSVKDHKGTISSQFFDEVAEKVIPGGSHAVSINSDDCVLNKLIETTDIEVKKEMLQETGTESDHEVESIDSESQNKIKKENDKDLDFNFDAESIDSEDSEAPLIKCKLRSMRSDSKDNTVSKKLKKEIEPDVISIHSEDSEVSASRRKKKKAEKDFDDPEFLKYVELRQDALIDENPQLTHNEIISYLYQTWLYEEISKSDLKRTEEIEQSGLVKGLNDTTQPPKKVKRKIKTEKEVVDDEVIPKEKPRRKATKPFYNEEYSDIEEEIAYFEIFNTKPKEITKTGQGLYSATKDDVIEIKDEMIEMYDQVESYFEDLTKPKPNIFKGLLREKVCEICEKTVNLIKCKGCNGMFHPACVEKESKKVEVQAPTRGRKKKKKFPRKLKGLDDSETHEDGSEDQNGSIEEIIDLESHTVDASVAEALEEKFTSKMMELIDNTPQYDSYSSDDGLDWTDTVPGKCEIIDIKPRLAHSQIDYSDFKCNNCSKYDTPVCFVCKSAVSKTECAIRQKCHVAHCHKYYHLGCLDHWPQTQFNGGEPSKSNKKISEYFEALTCPRHVCHTCVSDDPRGCKTRFSGDKLARCVRCPATYHSFTKCLPAGTQILTASHIICPRHYENTPGKVRCHVNTGWCFICALGGSLICCEYCPTSFHAECLNIKPPEGGYMCEDCETGRLPLYGEMVWVKLGHYRWWPGIILHPSEIPENILAVKHCPGEFAVRFFGQYDHYWVNRGRVFPFQEVECGTRDEMVERIQAEFNIVTPLVIQNVRASILRRGDLCIANNGDSGRISSQKSKIDAAFTTAMEHAQRACEILKTARTNEEESSDIASSLLPPHYVKLKVNKPCGSLCGRRVEDLESSLTQCECNPLDEDPCGPYSQCLNRVLLTECGPTCRAGDRCNNRAFEKRLYPKMVPYRTSARGWGLKTLEDIKAGQFVIEYVGELIDEEEFRRRMSRMHEMRDENFYFLTLDKERMIDAGPKGNLARFMNHCCEPNCETQKWTVLGDVRVGLFAINDIPANSEVTFNYNLECAGIEKKRCMCGAKRCSGYIGAKPKQEEPQSKKNKLHVKRAYRKRKNPEDSPSTNKDKPKRPIGRPPKPKELTEIEKDLLIIKNATNGLSSDESSRSLSSEFDRNPKALKRKRVSFSTEEVILYNGTESPSVKKHKFDTGNSVAD